MIKDRPDSLLSHAAYRRLPAVPVGVDKSCFPDLLQLDLFQLRGTLPITAEIRALWPNGIYAQPSEDVIRYYEAHDTHFNLISIVVNCAWFTRKDDLLLGHPYSICLFPATKRGKIDLRPIRTFSFLDLENLPTDEPVYFDFDPFTGEWELFAEYGFVAQSNVSTLYGDSIGFVLGHYFLATDANLDDVLLSNMVNAPADIQRKYHNFRVKRYFEPFTKVNPRRIWGAESPIELFLMQGLLRSGQSPALQTIVCRDGSIYPSYHHMFEEETFYADNDIITKPDLFFPNQRVAVFCDSGRHHRSHVRKARDTRISESLREVGITPVRIEGRQIVHDLDRAVETVLAHL